MLVSAYVNVLNKVAIEASAQVAFIDILTTVLNKDIADVKVNFLDWPDSGRTQRSKRLEEVRPSVAVNRPLHFVAVKVEASCGIRDSHGLVDSLHHTEEWFQCLIGPGMAPERHSQNTQLPCLKTRRKRVDRRMATILWC
jgi:hypothetical protein